VCRPRNGGLAPAATFRRRFAAKPVAARFDKRGTPHLRRVRCAAESAWFLDVRRLRWECKIDAEAVERIHDAVVDSLAMFLIGPRIDRRVPVSDLNIQTLGQELGKVHLRRELLEADDRMDSLADVFFLEDVANGLDRRGKRFARCVLRNLNVHHAADRPTPIDVLDRLVDER
jgi:hypothetical protein